MQKKIPSILLMNKNIHNIKINSPTKFIGNEAMDPKLIHLKHAIIKQTHCIKTLNSQKLTEIFNNHQLVPTTH